jgi:paraquat-inducible protein A
MSAPVTACPECDLLQLEPPLTERGRVRCARCRAFLYRNVPGGLGRALAYAATAAVLFLIANASRMVGLEAQGDRTTTTLVGTALALRDQHFAVVGALVVTMGLVMPAIEIGATLYLLAAIRFWPRRRCFPRALRLLHAVRPWSMIDVLVLGTLVALGRLSQTARVEIGTGLWAFGALMLMMAAIPTGFDLRELAARVTWRPSWPPASNPAWQLTSQPPAIGER